MLTTHPPAPVVPDSDLPTRATAPHRVGRYLPALIVLLAAVLRLLRLNLAEYRGDDDDMVTAATNALQHGWLQAHGLISSVPIDNGPVAMWLLMLPLAFGASLLIAQIWVAALNVGAVALCYHVTRTIWNRPLALIATTLFAVSPWAVMYSRRLWITAFDAPLALLAFWLLLRWLRDAEPAKRGGGAAIGNLLAFPPERLAPTWRRSALAYLPPALCALAFSAFFQAHVVPMGEAVTLLLVLLLAFRLLGRRRIAAFAVILTATMAPYVVTTVLPALGKTVAGQQARRPGVDLQSWFYFGNLVTGRGYQSIAPQGSRLLDATAAPFTALDWLAVALLALGVIATAYEAALAARQRDRFVAARGLSLLLWALIPPLGLMVHLVEVHPYYFVVSMPAIYILEAAGVRTAAALLRRGARGVTLIAGGLTALLTAAQLALAIPFFLVLPEVWTGADYGLPLQDTVNLANTAQKLAGGSLAVVGGYDHDVDYTIYSTLGRQDAGARYADDRGILEYAASGPPLLYLTTHDAAWETQTLRQQFGASQLAAVTLPGQGQTFRFFRPTNAAMADWVRQAAPPLPSPWRYGADAELDGARVQSAAAGGTAEVWLNWRLLREPSQPLLMRLEVTGSDGYVWTSTLAVSYPAGYWHAGDAARVAFLDRIALPLPVYLAPGAYDVRVRLLGIADGKQSGAPGLAGTLTVPVATAAQDATNPAPAVPNATAAAVAPGLTLVGWQIDRAQAQQNAVLGAVLFWRVTGPVATAPALRLRAPNGAIAPTDDTSQLSTTLPPSRWPTGALLADRHLLHIDGRAPTGPMTLVVAGPNGQLIPLGAVTVTSLPRATTLPAPAHTADATFGGVIRLTGYSLDPVAPSAGTALRLTLDWQAVGLPNSDETVFVHLLDAGGKLVAQADAPPGTANEPTSVWEPGQVIADTHTLALPAGLPAGQYTIQVGLYNAQSGARLSATGAGLAPSADSMDLGPLTIGR